MIGKGVPELSILYSIIEGKERVRKGTSLEYGGKKFIGDTTKSKKYKGRGPYTALI